MSTQSSTVTKAESITMEKAKSNFLEEQTKLLTKLPAPKQAPPPLESGTVKFFDDEDFDSKHFHVVEIKEYTSDQRHRINKANWNKTSYISWNLPVGTVMTVLEHVRRVENGESVADLRGCGRCLDLVGTGKTEAVQLSRLYMNDCFKGFFWREVDLKMGAIELFDSTKEDLKQENMWARHTIFLSEWQPGTVHSIQHWELQDKISYARWETLRDRQTVTLFVNADGSGDEYNNIKGWGTIKEMPDFGERDFNDKFSSFKWDTINPIREKCQDISIVPNVSGGKMYNAREEGENDGDSQQKVELQITEAKTREIYVETTDSTANSVGASLKTTAKAGTEGVASYEVEWSLEVTHSWGKSKTKGEKTTDTEVISIKQELFVTAKKAFTASMNVHVANIASKMYKVKAKRWYDQNLTGCVKDQGLWMREETVMVNISGSLYSKVTLHLKEYAIPKKDSVIDKGQQLANDAVDKGQTLGNSAVSQGQRLGKDLGKTAFGLVPKLGTTT
ncbi:hypothetical protein GMOD_00004522 [Pyrenophora seminiperda CCB06]|uniref:Uncharacterized protein n=1 Tax=Pyrenophora seminiperda CCB06 TaxID=1302712 RepID=A0A3M7M1M6_9PLEO|nr:hypothetical protein GMOD_00004522 [Pyrenophora seminiperda CCB06]